MHNRTSSRISSLAEVSSNPAHSNSQNTGTQQRVDSLMPATAAQLHSKPRNCFSSQSEQQSSSQQRLAVSAVQALASAVSRNQQIEHNQQSLQLQASPTMGNITSQLPENLQRPNSHYTSGNNEQQGRQPSAQNDPYHARPTAVPPRQYLQSSVSPDIPQTSINISNIVTNDDDPSQHIRNGLPPPESMEIPNRIGPRKMVNPYHHEDEQRKREIAEAKATAKREAAETEVAAKRKAAEDVAIPKVTLPKSSGNLASTAAPNSAKASISRATTDGGDMKKTQAPGTTGSEEDIDIAKEMKIISKKMRKLKDKDPKVFSKFWEDIRKGALENMHQTASPKIQATKTYKSPALSATAIKPPTPQSPALVHTIEHGQRSSTPLTKTETSQSQTSQSPPGNGYHAVVENNQDGLPDAGGFPAERRVRSLYEKRQPMESVSTSSPQPCWNLAPSAGPSAQPTIPQTHMVPLLTPQPVTASSGSNIWPEAKRNALAEAAVKALNTNPENKVTGITTEEIHAMLEQNPSYLDLCQLLENKGLKFHRGKFARSLLRDVPDLTSTKPAKVPLQPLTWVNTPAMNGPQPPTPANLFVTHGPQPGLAPPVYVLRGMPKGSQPVPYSMPAQTQSPILNSMKTERKQTAVFPAYHGPQPLRAPAPISKPPKPRFNVHNEPKPGAEKAISRKRGFSQVVDLTKLSDSENYFRSRKEPRIASPFPGPKRIIAYELQPQNIPRLSQEPPENFGSLQGSGVFSPSHTTFNPSQSQQIERPPQTASGQHAKAILAKPINKSEALKKTSYDPKTVARDVLIAAGRHPSERPLNAHLARLLGVHIELDSDLSTFDWNAVDPGGPKAPKVEVVDIPAEPPRFKLGERTGITRRGETVVNVEKTERRRRKEEGISSSSKVGELAKPGIPAAALASRFTTQTRQLLEDSLKPSNGLEKLPSRLRQSQVFDEDDTPSERLVKPQKRKARSQISVDISPPSHSRLRSTRSISKQPSENMEAQMQAGVKRRGRPPGSKNRNSSLADLKTDLKHRTAITSSARSMSPPKFTEYKCRWRNCKAQLHNLATLRRHIGKLHRPQKDETGRVSHICWWKNCDYHEQDSNGNIRPSKVFDSDAEWLEHLEDAHIHPLERKYGAGPSTTHIGKPSLDFNISKFLYRPSVKSTTRTISSLDPQTIAQDKARYLSDDHGRITTATASKTITDGCPADALTLTSVMAEDFIHVKSYEAAHAKARPGDKKDKIDIKKASEDFLRAMEVRKEKIGPGIDRGGCTLVTDARRATLVQDANIVRVVEYDY